MYLAKRLTGKNVSEITDFVSGWTQNRNSINQSFTSGDTGLLLRAFVVYVRPIIEYSSSIWLPVTKHDIELVEKSSAETTPWQGPRKVTKSGGSKRGHLWRAREREPITGVWGLCPQRGPGAEPLVRGSGGEAPLKLKSFLLLDVYWKRQICPYSPCIVDSVNYLNFQSNTDSGG